MVGEMYRRTQHVKITSLKPHITMQMEWDLSLCFASDCAFTVTIPNDLFFMHMQPVQSSRWANTNCDRHQQMRNGTRFQGRKKPTKN